MSEDGWEIAGQMARRRRQRLGLKQEDLQQYGGPRVSTVGKFERGAQDHFPLRTQHQIENALGWKRGSIEDVLRVVRSGEWHAWEGAYEAELIEDNIPDLSTPSDSDAQVRRATELSDDELLAEITFRMKKYAAALGWRYAEAERLADLQDRAILEAEQAAGRGARLVRDEETRAVEEGARVMDDRLRSDAEPDASAAAQADQTDRTAGSS